MGSIYKVIAKLRGIYRVINTFFSPGQPDFGTDSIMSSEGMETGDIIGEILPQMLCIAGALVDPAHFTVSTNT
jgi:hypothetical protein